MNYMMDHRRMSQLDQGLEAYAEKEDSQYLSLSLFK